MKKEDNRWMTLEIGGKANHSDKDAQRYKKFLRGKGIEVRKLPFQISENVVFIRAKELPRVVKLFKHRKLREIS